jgi:hypothetical protein
MMKITKKSIIEKTYSSENLPSPLFALRVRDRSGSETKEG